MGFSVFYAYFFDDFWAISWFLAIIQIRFLGDFLQKLLFLLVSY